MQSDKCSCDCIYHYESKVVYSQRAHREVPILNVKKGNSEWAVLGLNRAAVHTLSEIIDDPSFREELQHFLNEYPYNTRTSKTYPVVGIQLPTKVIA